MLVSVSVSVGVRKHNYENDLIIGLAARVQARAEQKM